MEVSCFLTGYNFTQNINSKKQALSNAFSPLIVIIALAYVLSGSERRAS